MRGLTELVFWGAAALVVYGYVGYPLLLLVAGRWRRRPAAPAGATPRVTVVVSVHNGESLIDDKLRNCLALEYPPDRLEILVASDASTDATDERVRRLGDPRVRLVAAEQRRGKEAAQRRALARATGEVVLFTDVGVSVCPGALRAMVEHFADPTVGCVSGVDRVVDEAGDTVGEGAFVRYETWLKRLESRAGTIVGNSGWLFAVRRDLCGAWPDDMPSDFAMLLRAVQRGRRGVVEPRAVGRARATGSGRREFDRKVRTMVRGMVALGAHRELLNPLRYGLFSIQLASHKLLRWLLPALLAAILASSAALAPSSGFHRLAFLAQLLFYAVGVLVPGARIPRFFVTSSAAALVAWRKYLGGERFVVWEPTPRAPASPR